MADILSLESQDGIRCVDIIARPEGGYGFKAFRRDPEDRRWTMTADFSAKRYETRGEAEAAALDAVPWLRAERRPAGAGTVEERR